MSGATKAEPIHYAKRLGTWCGLDSVEVLELRDRAGLDRLGGGPCADVVSIEPLEITCPACLRAVADYHAKRSAHFLALAGGLEVEGAVWTVVTGKPGATMVEPGDSLTVFGRRYLVGSRRGCCRHKTWRAALRCDARRDPHRERDVALVAKDGRVLASASDVLRRGLVAGGASDEAGKAEAMLAVARAGGAR